MKNSLEERIRELIQIKSGGNEAGFARLIGTSQSSLNNKLQSGGDKRFFDIAARALLAFPDVSREWLLAGEGDINTPAPAQKEEPKEQAPVSLIGFASCSMFGWGGKIRIPVPVTPPHWRDDMIVAMATGESLLPEGIGHGHVVFCDPHASPMPGEIVYVETIDDKATLKKYLGQGVSEGGTPMLDLQGWKDKTDELTPQVDFCLHLPLDTLKIVAPVIYVQRRL